MKILKQSAELLVQAKGIGQRDCGDYSEQQVKAIHTGLKILAGVCDGAQAQDGQGFNKLDSNFGKSLAYQDSLSPRQVEHGLKLVIKYQRQLSAELLAQAKGE